MDTIYRNASNNLILLEDLDIAPDVERALRTLAGNPTEPESTARRRMHLSDSALSVNFSSCHKQGLIEYMYKMMEGVAQCRWFSRAGCSHEYHLNPARTFLFVGHTYDCLTLQSTFFPAFYQLSARIDDSDRDVYLKPVFQSLSSGVGASSPVDIHDLNFALLFVELEKLACSQRRDIVSIALNTSGIFLRFKGEVLSRADCRFKLGLLLLAVGNATVLHSVGPPLYKWPAPSHQGVMRWPLGDIFRFFAHSWPLMRISPDHGIEQFHAKVTNWTCSL